MNATSPLHVAGELPGPRAHDGSLALCGSQGGVQGVERRELAVVRGADDRVVLGIAWLELRPVERAGLIAVASSACRRSLVTDIAARAAVRPSVAIVSAASSFAFCASSSATERAARKSAALGPAWGMRSRSTCVPSSAVSGLPPVTGTADPVRATEEATAAAAPPPLSLSLQALVMLASARAAESVSAQRAVPRRRKGTMAPRVARNPGDGTTIGAWVSRTILSTT